MDLEEVSQDFILWVEANQGVSIVGNGTNIYLKEKESIIQGGNI